MFTQATNISLRHFWVEKVPLSLLVGYVNSLYFRLEKMFDSPGQTDRVREEMTVDMPEIMFRLEQFGAPGDATWIPRVQDWNFGTCWY